MLCQKCNHNNATVHFEQNINGKITELDLCEDCAKEMNIGFNMDIFPDPVSLISNFWGESDSLFHAPHSSIGEHLCPTCHSGLSSLIGSSFLGCTDCYDEFDSFVENNLRKYQRGIRHIGKRPGSLGNTASKPENRQTPVSEADKLRAELKKAVEEENYEKAAELRDKIKELGDK